jgi:hypothetical protein
MIGEVDPPNAECNGAARLSRSRIKEMDVCPESLSYRHRPLAGPVPGCAESDWFLAKSLDVLLRVREQRAELMRMRHDHATGKFSCSRGVCFLLDPEYSFPYLKFTVVRRSSVMQSNLTVPFRRRQLSVPSQESRRRSKWELKSLLMTRWRGYRL